jgi:hypothetical protein
MIQMVGPLSSEEIEDVVSSVRRLVSNEQRPRTLSRDLNADRLLLTPALRVVADTSPLSPLILATPMSEQATAQVVEPEPDAKVAESAPEAVAEAPMVVEADWEEEIWTAPQPSLAEVALGAEEAEVLTASSDEGEGDALIGAFAAELDETPEPWAQVETEWEEDNPITFVPLRRRAENLAAKVAAAVQGDSIQISPQPSESAEVSAALTDDQEGAPWLDAGRVEDPLDLEPALPPEPGSEETSAEVPGQEHMATELLDADGSPIAVLDEAALQDIVRQIIRDELQGVLGERITRNVRKLVRSEINRALVARDLD